MVSRGGTYGDLHGDGTEVDPVPTQAGPLMVRHVIHGHEVLLPAGAKLYPPAKPGDDPSDCPLGGTY